MTVTELRDMLSDALKKGQVNPDAKVYYIESRYSDSSFTAGAKEIITMPNNKTVLIIN